MSPALIVEDTHANSSSDKAVFDHTNDGFGTKAIHVGSEPSEETGAVIPAISLSTTYKQERVGVHKGYEYTRSGNPNRDALERTLTAIEAGAGQALAFASGSSATATLLQSLGPGAHVLSVNDVYGGTFRYMTKVAAENQGLEVDFVELEGLGEDEIRSHVRPNTKVSVCSGDHFIVHDCKS
jgi:cystathionine gamma-lyase